MTSVTLESFAKRYQPLITVQINWPALLASNVTVHSHRWRFSRLLTLNMPWYAYNGTLSLDFYATKDDPHYRPIKLSDALSYGLLDTRASIRQARLPRRLHPIPVATDTHTGKTIILDSNTTLTALLRNGSPSSRRLPVLELRGPDCHQWLPDFDVLRLSDAHGRFR